MEIADGQRVHLYDKLWAVDLGPFGVRIDCEDCGRGVVDRGDGVEHTCGLPPVWVTKVDDN